MNRRDALKLAGGLAAGSVLLSGCGEGGLFGTSTGTVLGSQGERPGQFRVPLPVPAVLRPVRSDATGDHYEITQRVATANILPGRDTRIWGYEGTFPGPTIVARRGRPVIVRHRNELPVPTVVHLHGGVTPPEDDGYPTDLVLPVGGWSGHDHHEHGGTTPGRREYRYPMDQPAATLWYHDHRMDFTGPQVYRGLAGMLLVHDDVEDALPLPRGERDIPLMICDRSFTAEGALRYPSLDPALRDRPGVQERYAQGVLGDVIVVNGVAWPYHQVSATRYRLRILNASNARRYRLALDPPPPHGPAFTRIGSDAGLLDRPRTHDKLDIAQAQRCDVLVDFSAYPVGTRVTLRNEFGDGPTARVMRFDVVRRGRDDSAVPDRLAEVEPLTRASATVTRSFVFDQRRAGWAVNGRTFDPDRVDANPALGSTEIWRLTTDAHHPVHLHLAHFQVLSRDGRPPGSQDAGWRDTVDVPSGVDTEIIARFTGYRGRYVFHCHNLEHEDMAMMANMRVV